MPFDWRERTATFGLNTTIPWTIEVVGGIQQVEADLRAIDVRGFDIVGGAERVQLELGQPRGEVDGPDRRRRRRPLRLERPARRSRCGSSVAGGTDWIVARRRPARAEGRPDDRSSRPAGHGQRDRIDVAVVGGAKSIEVVARP